jgi:hypothetical protein
MKRLLLIFFLLSVVCYAFFNMSFHKKMQSENFIENGSEKSQLTNSDILDLTINIFSNNKSVEYGNMKKFSISESDIDNNTEAFTKASEITENFQEENFTMNFTFVVEDYNGNVIYSRIYFYKNLDKLENETEGKTKYNLIAKLNKKVDKIEIKNLEIDENEEKLKIDVDVPLNKISDAVDAYAIFTDTLDFKEAVITVKAKGKELWKCENWDFAQRECKPFCRFDEENKKEICENSWKKLMDINPGGYYSFVITEKNAGFAEYENVNESIGYENVGKVENEKNETIEIEKNETKDEIGEVKNTENEIVKAENNTEDEITGKENLNESEKNNIARNFWPMAVGNYWLFENENGTETYLFEIKECNITKDCFSIYKTDIINNFTVINNVIFDGNIYKLTSETNKNYNDYTKNPVPVLYIGNGTKTYKGGIKERYELNVNITSFGMKNITTKLGNIEAYALNYYSKKSRGDITAEANYTIYYALGIGPVQIDWVDGSVHKIKGFVIK